MLKGAWTVSKKITNEYVAKLHYFSSCLPMSFKDHSRCYNVNICHNSCWHVFFDLFRVFISFYLQVFICLVNSQLSSYVITTMEDVKILTSVISLVNAGDMLPYSISQWFYLFAHYLFHFLIVTYIYFHSIFP